MAYKIPEHIIGPRSPSLKANAETGSHVSSDLQNQRHCISLGPDLAEKEGWLEHREMMTTT